MPQKSHKETKAERHRIMSDYIQEKKEVSRKELCEKFDIKENTLTADLRTLRDLGLMIEQPKRSGMVFFTGDTSDTASDKPQSIREQMSSAFFRYWFIVRQLAAHPGGMSIKDLTLAFIERLAGDDTYFSDLSLQFSEASADDLFAAFKKDYQLGQTGISPTTLRTLDLEHLMKIGWVRLQPISKTDYKRDYNDDLLYFLDDQSPLILMHSYYTLGDFCDQYALNARGSAWKDQLLPAYQRASVIADIDMTGTENNSGFYAFKGKRNSTSFDAYEKLQAFDYRHHLLRIPYSTNAGRHTTVLLSVGMIVYSFARDQFYIIGETPARQYCLRLANVDIPSIEVLPQKNTVYNSAFYQQMLHEMFSVSADEPNDVRVRFQYFNRNIRLKVRALVDSRPKTARMTISPDGKEIIYTDRIRGLDDFAAYLRSYGRSAIVEEPSALAEKMMGTAQKVKAAYEAAYGGAQWLRTANDAVVDAVDDASDDKSDSAKEASQK